MKLKNARIHFLPFGLLVLFCLLVYSCLHDEWGADTIDGITLGNNKELTASEAERWYNGTNQSIATVRALNSTDVIATKPRWSRAVESRKGKFEVVETPLMVNGSVVILDNETKSKIDPEKSPDKIRNLARMVVIKNLKTGEVCNFIMIFVGSYDYLMESNTLPKNSYLHREPDFDGSVYFYKSGQGLVNGWRYKAGKIVAAISQGMEDGYYIDTRAGRPEVPCSQENIWVDEWRCWNEPYWDNDFGVSMSAVCDKTSKPGNHQICVEEGSGEGGSWDGGGGYNPPTNPPTDPPEDPCERAKSLSLNKDFIARLSNIHDQTFPYKVDNTEHGFIQTPQGETIHPAIAETGRVKYNAEQLTGKEFLEWYHSHPDGGPITSLADLKALATQYQQGHIKSGNFTYGIVSEFGCLSIMISSAKDFEKFVTQIRAGQLDGIFNMYVANGETVGTAEGSIEKLANFFQKANAGLSLLFRPAQDGIPSSWIPKGLDSNAHLVNIRCD